MALEKNFRTLHYGWSPSMLRSLSPFKNWQVIQIEVRFKPLIFAIPRGIRILSWFSP